MYQASAGFTTAVAQSHVACFKLQVLVDGIVALEIENTSDLDDDRAGIVGGTITCDASAQVWRSGHVQIATRDDTLIPLLAGDYLQPLGNELRIWRGIVVDGTPEYVPVVTGPMFNVAIEDNAGYLIDVDVYDRSRSLSSYGWSDVYTIAAGTNVATALLALVADRFPAAIYGTMTPSFVSTTATTPIAVLGGTGTNDPGKDAVDLAASAGLIFYFDRLGNPVLAAMPNPVIQNPVTTVAEGTNLFTVRKVLTAEGVYNGVIVTGQPSGATVTYTASTWDTDPTSPTYYLGKFGRRPQVIVDNLVNSTAAAQDQADARLIRHVGALEEISFSTVVNPTLDPLDVILLTRDRLGIDSRYVLDSFPIPLDVTTAMGAVCRVRNG